MDFSHIRNYLFLGLLLVVTVLFFSTIKTFTYPIFWAAVIAGMFYPFYRKINSHLKHANLSAVITLALVLIVIILPLFIMGVLLFNQSINLYSSIHNNGGEIIQTINKTTEWIKHNPLTAKLNIDDTFWVAKFSETTQLFTSYIISAAKNITQQSVTFFFMFIVMFYALFFFVRDGQKLLKKIMYLCPLGDKYEKMLYDKFTSTVRATIKGNLIISIIQGVLAGILFTLVNVNGAIILGLITLIASMIPALGTFIVWLPVGIVMLIAGHTWEGVVILIFGGLIISTIDNFLRPVLIGKDTQLHPLIILFSTLGGLVVFGASGFIIGPIIASLFMAFWNMYEEYYREDLKQN